jgi:hypothetical protein
MKRIRLFNNIVEAFSRFSSEIAIFNQNSQFDINDHSEYLLIPLLNSVFDYRLSNANRIKKNFPAVDLIDDGNGIAFQISSTVSSKKIKDTLEKFTQYDLHKKYDTLYILFLTTHKVQVSLEGLDAIIGGKLVFDATNLLNLSDLAGKIKELSISKIEQIESLLTEEFREEKVSRRIREADKTSKKKEPYIANIIPVEFPSVLYIADLGIGKADYRKLIKKRRIPERDIIKKAINELTPDHYCEDWVCSSDQIISFRDLSSDPCLSQLVDQGTITPLSIEEYCSSESKILIFKSLLGFTFRERSKDFGFEWYQKEKLYRVKSPKLAKETKVTWTMDQKAQPRAVIKEIWNKEKTHIVCFRHLAFFLSVHVYNNIWYLSFKPTYSFTSDGYRKSRFSKYYASGKKKEDDNESVYHDFRFILWTLRKMEDSGLFRKETPYEFKLKELFMFESDYPIDESIWNPKLSKTSDDSINSTIKLFE